MKGLGCEEHTTATFVLLRRLLDVAQLAHLTPFIHALNGPQGHLREKLVGAYMYVSGSGGFSIQFGGVFYPCIMCVL